MKKARTIIAGGTVVTATDRVEADVLIEDEKVVALAARWEATFAPQFEEQP